ncbi:bacteriocin biosynthesis protein (plasmid) [Streptomyces globosus]|uniref:Bacteriocin biosynthesis protein n=1 Tax=Streptomyces globosus TaxID=68209 RepID=A0A344UB94_9ACTN|nr:MULTISPECIES: thiopeptide-type bacteriocin biosynthesis protein [Streptomyces]AXE28165.1 bacteriocin biosynthesis protein [Streptomyces globosus]
MDTPPEAAVLAALTGQPLSQVAARHACSVPLLADAVDLYRAAGRAALSANDGAERWQQVNVEFSDYGRAREAFSAYLLPALRQAYNEGLIASWWFVRKHPCWRLRVLPAPATSSRAVRARLTANLDAAIACGAVQQWRVIPYEPETAAFGGAVGIQLAHDLFHTDSEGALAFLHTADANPSRQPDAKVTSLLVVTLLLRAAGQEWSEQGDVWARVEASRPLPAGIPGEQVSSMTPSIHRLLTINTAGLTADDELLMPVAAWAAGLEKAGRCLADAHDHGRLTLGLRSILSRHIIFHWNRMGFTTRQQAIWARAARATILGE